MRRTPPQPFCFGKLPIAGDFLRGDGQAPEFAELDTWIQHGLYETQQRLGAAWQDRFDALPPARFLWSNAGTVLAGWWISSRDAVGRRFPFLLATRLVKVPAGDVPLLPLMLRGFFDDARALLDTGFEGMDVVGTIERVQAMPCDVDVERARAEFAASTQQAAPADGWSGHDDAPELLLHDLAAVSGQPSPPRYSLRWPTRGAGSDIAFWLAAMARFGTPSPRLLLWNEADDGTSAVARAVLCDLHPRLFAGVLFPDVEDDDTYDMGRGLAEDARSRDARDRFGPSVAAADQAAALAALPPEPR